MDLIERPSSTAARHPWEMARTDFFLKLLSEMGVGATRSWLDVGAGDAWFATQLRGQVGARPSITCWDINYDEETIGSAPPGVELTAARPSGAYDGILMLDVIEHVERDQHFVDDVVDSFSAEGGWVLVSVPAYMSLYTSHDASLLHYRRYSPSACRTVLHRAGLEIQAEGGLFHSLAFARGAQVAAERLGRTPDLGGGIGGWKGGRLSTRVLTAALQAEGRLSLRLGRSGRHLPGLSYWAFCRRSPVPAHRRL